MSEINRSEGAWKPNNFWVWEGLILRAAQSTLAGAEHYRKAGMHITSEPKHDGKQISIATACA